MSSDKKYTVKKIRGTAYLAIDLEAIGANQTIPSLAERFKLDDERVLESLIAFRVNRRALEYLYEEEVMNGSSGDVSVRRMRRECRNAAEVFKATHGYRGPAYKTWGLSIHQVSVIILPISERFALVIERHKNEQERQRKIEVETPALEGLIAGARELHTAFASQRKRLNRSLRSDMRRVQVARHVKHLIEEDTDRKDLLIVDPIGLDVVVDNTDEPQEDIDRFEAKVKRYTNRSNETCKELVEFLESDLFKAYMSKRYLIQNQRVAKVLHEVTRGIHSVPSGAEYVRRKVEEGVLKEASGGEHPVWSRLYEPQQNGTHTANQNGDARSTFSFLKKTNGAILEILKTYASALQEARLDEIQQKVVDPINELWKRRNMSVKLKRKKAQLEFDTPEGRKNVSVDVLDVEFLDESGPSRGLSRTVKVLDSLGNVLDVVNTALVAKQLMDEVDRTGGLGWQSVANAGNALAGFGGVTFEVAQASGIISVRESVALGLRGAFGIVGGATQAAVAVDDFYANMDAMEADNAAGDLLLAGGGMLMAGGAAFAWAGGVSTILIPIGAAVSLLGAGLKLFLSDSAEENYIKGTRYYPHWSEQAASEKYYLVRKGWDNVLVTDDGWFEARMAGDTEKADAKTHFYLTLQVEFAGDHNVEMEVDLYDTDGLDEPVTIAGRKTWALPVKHSVGRFQVPQETSVLEQSGHDTLDLEARLYVSDGESREHVCDVSYL